jgi:hypothetical protein
VKNLTPKAIRFVAEALRLLAADYERRLSATDDEDEAADLANDLGFVTAVLADVEAP